MTSKSDTETLQPARKFKGNAAQVHEELAPFTGHRPQKVATLRAEHTPRSHSRYINAITGNKSRSRQTQNKAAGAAKRARELLRPIFTRKTCLSPPLVAVLVIVAALFAYGLGQAGALKSEDCTRYTWAREDYLLCRP